MRQGCPHRTDGKCCLSCAGRRGGSKMKAWVRNDDYNAGYSSGYKAGVKRGFQVGRYTQRELVA